jgi:hypothetical protein
MEPLQSRIKYLKFSGIDPQPFPNNLSWGFGMISLNPNVDSEVIFRETHPDSNPALATIATLSYFGSR